MAASVRYGLSIARSLEQRGWVDVRLYKTWQIVESHTTRTRRIVETSFDRGTMSDDEVCITAMREIARAMEDDLS